MIHPRSAQVLNQVVSALKQHPDITLELNGHTDSFGSNSYNFALGKRRANAVRYYLLRQGIAPNRITIHSIGEDRLQSPGNSALSRARNRRVTFTFNNLKNLGVATVEQEMDLQP
jgi:outer membrane protein OmpA-like peptidoglycan-associated protein